MNVEDLRYYINSVSDTRRILSDMIYILRRQEDTISDIVNHPTYEVSNIYPSRYVRNRSFVQSPLSTPQMPSYMSSIPRRPTQPPISRPTQVPISRPINITTPPRFNTSVGPTIIPPTSTNIPPVSSNTATDSSDDIYNSPSNVENIRSPRPPRPQNTEMSTRIADLLGAALMGELNNLSPVPIRPTQNQILDATETISFSSIENPSYTRCPISHESFVDSSHVCRITHCGHYFDPESLYTWFTRNVRCPVCRYDIRTHVTSSNRHRIQEEEDDEEEELIEESSPDSTNNQRTNIQEDVTRGDSLEDFINHVRADQRDNPLPSNTRRVYRYQFDVTPFVTRALNSIDDNSGNTL